MLIRMCGCFSNHLPHMCRIVCSPQLFVSASLQDSWFCLLTCRSQLLPQSGFGPWALLGAALKLFWPGDSAARNLQVSPISIGAPAINATLKPGMFIHHGYCHVRCRCVPAVRLVSVHLHLHMCDSTFYNRSRIRCLRLCAVADCWRGRHTPHDRHERCGWRTAMCTVR